MDEPHEHSGQWRRLAVFFAAVLGLTVIASWLIEHDQLALGMLVYLPAVWLAWPRRR